MSVSEKTKRKVITTDHMDITRAINECYKQLFVHKLDNLNEKFLKRCNLPKFTQKEIDNFNSCIFINEIE